MGYNLRSYNKLMERVKEGCKELIHFIYRGLHYKDYIRGFTKNN